MKKGSGLGAALGRGAARASDATLPAGYPYYGHAPTVQAPTQPMQMVMPTGYGQPAMSPMAGYGHPGHPHPGAMPHSIEGSFPPGIYEQTMVNPASPMMPYGMPQMVPQPMGQNISVAMNAPSPHLTTREWVNRGILGALGASIAWLPRLGARIIEEILRMFVGVFGKLLLVILFPSMLILGINLAMMAATYKSVEGGAVEIMHKGRHAMHGIGKGLTDDLPPEQVDKSVKKDAKNRRDEKADEDARR